MLRWLFARICGTCDHRWGSWTAFAAGTIHRERRCVGLMFIQLRYCDKCRRLQVRRHREHVFDINHDELQQLTFQREAFK